MLDRAGGGSSDVSDNDFGSQGAMQARKPAMVGAGGGKRGEMDDEIPF
jgi:single-strand DNA-binding protein